MNPEVTLFLLGLSFALWLIAWDWMKVRRQRARDRVRPLRIGERINGQPIESVSNLPFTAYYAGGRWVDREGKEIQ